MSGLQVSGALRLSWASDMGDSVHKKRGKDKDVSSFEFVDQGGCGFDILTHLQHKQPCFLPTVPQMGIGLGCIVRALK